MLLVLLCFSAWTLPMLCLGFSALLLHQINSLIYVFCFVFVFLLGLCPCYLWFFFLMDYPWTHIFDLDSVCYLAVLLADNAAG